MSLALYIEDLLKTVHDLEEQREALLATMDELLNYYNDPLPRRNQHEQHEPRRLRRGAQWVSHLALTRSAARPEWSTL